MAESEIPTLTVLLRKIGTLEGKHGESSPMLLSTIAKVRDPVLFMSVFFIVTFFLSPYTSLLVAFNVTDFGPGRGAKRPAVLYP